MAWYRDRSIRAVITLIQDNIQKLPQLEQRLDINDLLLVLVSKPVEEVNEQLLSLLVPLNLFKSLDIVNRQLLLTIPGFEKDSLDRLFPGSVKVVGLEGLLVDQIFIVLNDALSYFSELVEYLQGS